MEIRSLKVSEWQVFKRLFREEFDSDLPPITTAEFVGVFDEGRLKGFILIEDVKFIGQICIFDVAENPMYARSLVQHIRDRFQSGQSVAAVASEKRFEALFEHLGLERIPGVLFRRG